MTNPSKSKLQKLATSVIADNSTHLQSSINKQLAGFEPPIKKLIIKDAQKLSLNAAFWAKESVEVAGLSNLKNKEAQIQLGHRELEMGQGSQEGGYEKVSCPNTMGGPNVCNEKNCTLEIKVDAIKGTTEGSEKRNNEEAPTMTASVDFEAEK